ncbi:MAG: L,D-transpeptidase family protein [Gammaproteobacteria bacterium]
MTLTRPAALRHRLAGCAAALCAMLAATPLPAMQTFTLDPASPDLVGELFLASTVQADTLSDLARAYDQGYREMRLANPGVDPWLPGEGAEVMVPNLYVLPDAPRRGVVINVPEMRMYVFPQATRVSEGKVLSFPVSIGRQNWATPKGSMTIVAKVKDPAWYPPKSIREEHAAEGDILPRVVPPGPDNPLGQHALRLSQAGYLIHGTNRPYGIGMRVTHGCIRMYPKDVATIYEQLPVGTPVHVVNQPYKVGISRGRIYLEVHPHLDEDENLFDNAYSHVVKLILERVKAYEVKLVWADIRAAVKAQDGIPTAVGTYRPPAAVATVVE